jgi:hypothetical protein
MDVMNTNQISEQSTPMQLEVTKKAIDTKEQRSEEDLKVLEQVNQQTQQRSAEMTGVGSSLNILG